MRIKRALQEAAALLRPVTDRARFEAELLLCHHLGCERIYLTLHDDKEIETNGFFQLVKKRATHYPIEYLTREVSFYDTTLFIQEGVLIPRPETELLVEHAAKIINTQGLTRIAEIGVGSGAISVMLARLCPDIHIIATDINPVAIETAKQNIKRHGLEDRIKLRQTSLLEGIDEKIEMVVSNPPYIAADFSLPKPVTYEPENALFGGKQGDELLHRIVKVCKDRGIAYLACETGYDQKEPMRRLFDTLGLSRYEFYQDLATIDRGFTLRLR